MKVKLLLSFVIISAFLTSCARKVYFNSEIKETLEVANIPLTNIQFYNDKKVVLRRELASESTIVESGKVKFKNGKYIQFVTLSAKTPGVCTSVDGDNLSISFEKGDDKSLKFRNMSSKMKEMGYRLCFPDLEKGAGSKILYDGNEYYLRKNGSDTKLMIKKGVLSKIKVKKRRMKGIRL